MKKLFKLSRPQLFYISLLGEYIVGGGIEKAERNNEIDWSKAETVGRVIETTEIFSKNKFDVYRAIVEVEDGYFSVYYNRCNLANWYEANSNVTPTAIRVYPSNKIITEWTVHPDQHDEVAQMKNSINQMEQEIDELKKKLEAANKELDNYYHQLDSQNEDDL